jgi:hypothetical protein
MPGVSDQLLDRLSRGADGATAALQDFTLGVVAATHALGQFGPRSIGGGPVGQGGVPAAGAAGDPSRGLVRMEALLKQLVDLTKDVRNQLIPTLSPAKQDQQAPAAARNNESFGKALDGLQRLLGQLPGLGAPLAGLITAGRLGAAAAGGAGAGGTGAALGGLATAAAAAVTAINGIVGASAHFVEALNPAAVLGLNLAIRDLTAVVGVALQPVVQAATGFARELGSVLLPIMQRLAPIVSRLADLFLDVAGKALDSFAKAVDSALPLAATFLDLLESSSRLAETFQSLSGATAVLNPLLALLNLALKPLAWLSRQVSDAFATLAPLGDALKALFGGLAGALEGLGGLVGGLQGLDFVSGFIEGFANATKYAADAIKNFTAGLLVGVARLAKFLDFGTGLGDRFIGGLIKSLQPAQRQNAEGLAVPLNPQIQSALSFSQQVDKAAFSAGLSGGKSKEQQEEDWRERVAKLLQEIRDNGKARGGAGAPEPATSATQEFFEGAAEGFAPKGGVTRDFISGLGAAFGIPGG